MMKKRRFTQAIVVFALFCLATQLYASTPWLHTDGNLIKDPCGNTVVLRGIDLIDLGFLQDWEGGAINMIDRLTDKSDPCGNSPGWYPRVIRINITPPDSVSGWPHPFNPSNTDLYDLLRSVVNYCKAKDLYAIIDWHYVANTYDHVASTSEFWTYMAPRFANDSHVIFELFNEPINDLDGDWIFNGNDTDDWLSVRTDMQTWIDIVRTYAPNNLILVAGSFYSQNIGPAAAYPLDGNNIVIVSHIYSGHWLDSYWAPSYKAEINTALTRYPVFMTEWGFSQSASSSDGNITSYGQPLADFREARKISNSAWVSSYDWGPPMFWDPAPGVWPKPVVPGPWSLRVGEGEMGGFVKDMLYAYRNNDQVRVPYTDVTGFIRREVWTGISGTSVSSLTSDINYPTNPNIRGLLTSFEGPTNWADNYGTRIRGYLYPSADGDYTFWIASDDSSQLWLSTDADPCHAAQIAYVSGSTNSREWTKYTSQASTPKPLLAGHKYYIEALQKAGTGGDNIAVAWEGPDITQQVIDGAYLSPWLYNFKDYAIFAPQWLKTNCSRSNAWCSGADRDRDGNVQIDDLAAFADVWLWESNL
jgi:hypothetical protein